MSFSLYIKPEVQREIMFYVNKSPVEVSGLGRVILSNGIPVVNKIYLLEQENSAASTDLNDEAVAKLLYQTRDDIGDLTFWWHSHVNMGTTWSSIDISTIKQLGKNGYILATVFNKRNEYRSAYFQKGDDFLPSVFMDDITTKFEYIPSISEKSQWEKEFEEKCKTKNFLDSYDNVNFPRRNIYTGDYYDNFEKFNERAQFDDEGNLLNRFNENEERQSFVFGLDVDSLPESGLSIMELMRKLINFSRTHDFLSSDISIVENMWLCDLYYLLTYDEDEFMDEGDEYFDNPTRVENASIFSDVLAKDKRVLLTKLNQLFKDYNFTDKNESYELQAEVTQLLLLLKDNTAPLKQIPHKEITC